MTPGQCQGVLIAIAAVIFLGATYPDLARRDRIAFVVAGVMVALPAFVGLAIGALR